MAKKSSFVNIIGEAVVTPKARLAFPSLEEPDTGHKYSNDKFKATLLFDKDETDFDSLQSAVENTAQDAWDDIEDLEDIDVLPFRDGADKDEKYQGFESAIYVIAQSKYPVPCYGPDKTPLQAKELYPGCYCRAVLSPMAYENSDGRGITFLLQGVQFLEDGPRFGGGSIDPTDIFDVWGDDDEEEPKPKKRRTRKKTSTKAAEPEEEDDEEEEEEQETKPKRRTRRKKTETTEKPTKKKKKAKSLLDMVS